MPNQAKNFDQPEETRSFENGRVDLVEIAGNKVGRTNLEPGWRWSEAVKPIVGTDSCEVAHVGYAISGRLHVVMDDGTEVDIKAGDVYELAPGHDAWVDGDEAFRESSSKAWRSTPHASPVQRPSGVPRHPGRFPYQPSTSHT